MGNMTEDQKFCAHMAKVYIAQAQARRKKSIGLTSFRGWLLSIAAKHRALYLEAIREDRKPKRNGEIQLGFDW